MCQPFGLLTEWGEGMVGRARCIRDYGPMHPVEAIVCLLIALTSYSAWLTHIVDCAGDRLWGFLVAGAIVFPVGIVHGAGVWIGVW